MLCCAVLYTLAHIIIQKKQQQKNRNNKSRAVLIFNLFVCLEHRPHKRVKPFSSYLSTHILLFYHIIIYLFTCNVVLHQVFIVIFYIAVIFHLSTLLLRLLVLWKQRLYCTYCVWILYCVCMCVRVCLLYRIVCV